MTHPSVPPLTYVYGVVGATPDLARAPAGLDDGPLRTVTDGAFTALVSSLDGTRYAPPALERAMEDVEWIAPHAVAHDRVLTWASDAGPVVPLPMWTLFTGDAAVREMLRGRARELDAALSRAAEGREYVLRVYRLDAELAPHAAALSPRLATLEREAAAAAPGQRYLLMRKLDAERKRELRSIGRDVARATYDALAPFAAAAHTADGARRDDPPEQALVLDAAYLVAPETYADFQRALTALVERHHGRGFRFDFTGPWPPYHFMSDVLDAGPDVA